MTNLSADERHYMLDLLKASLESLRDVLETAPKGEMGGLQKEAAMIRGLIAKLHVE